MLLFQTLRFTHRALNKAVRVLSWAEDEVIRLATDRAHAIAAKEQYEAAMNWIKVREVAEQAVDAAEEARDNLAEVAQTSRESLRDRLSVLPTFVYSDFDSPRVAYEWYDTVGDDEGDEA